MYSQVLNIKRCYYSTYIIFVDLPLLIEYVFNINNGEFISNIFIKKCKIIIMSIGLTPYLKMARLLHNIVAYREITLEFKALRNSILAPSEKVSDSAKRKQTFMYTDKRINHKFK